jgi:uncharacterized protein (TIGR03086 family)
MDTQVMADAITGFEARLALVDEATLGAATPCTEWDVRTLVNHVVAELLWVPPLLAGSTIAEVGDRFAGDVLGADPLAAWRAAAIGAMSAAGAPGVQEETVHLSFGDFPGSDYLGQITSDVVIHTWDLARALDADDRLDPALVGFVADFLAPQVEAWRSAGAFGAVAAVGEGADPQARLLASTGRTP